MTVWYIMMKLSRTDLTAEQITRMELALFEQRDELKRDFLWRIYNEMIVRSSFTLAYLHSRVCLFDFLRHVANCMKYCDGKEQRHERKHIR